jgi:hypothetical protein
VTEHPDADPAPEAIAAEGGAGPGPVPAGEELGDEAGPPATAGELSPDEPSPDELSPDERTELERLRAETAQLHSQSGGPRKRRRFSWRATVSIVLIVLGSILAPVAVLGVWAGNEVSDTGRWVDTVQPLIEDPAIQNVLTDKISTAIENQLNLNSLITQTSTQLNDRGLPRLSTLLGTFGPQITSAVYGYIHTAVQRVISSPAMARAWMQVNTVAHQSLVALLSGQGKGALSTANGQIMLNLGPLIVVAKQDLVNHGFALASNIPPISPTVALFQSDDLGKAQAGYRLIKALKIVLPILVLALLAGGIFAARGRRRALIGAALGLAGSMLVLAIILLIARSIYLNSVPPTVLPADAAAAAFDAMVHFIKVGLRVVLAVGLVVALGAFLTGPSRASVQTRSAVSSGLRWVRDFGERRGVSTGPAGTWTYAHRRGLRIGAVALFALIFVFWGHPTAVTVIVLAVLLLVVLALIELIGRPPAQLRVEGPA